MQRWAIVSFTGLGVLLGLLAWREWAHAGKQEAWLEESAQLQEKLAICSSGLKEKTAQLADREAALEQLQLEATSYRDRAGNLEAQRNHLRDETGRQAERARLALLEAEEAQTELESARQKILNLSAQPRELQARLDQAEAQLEELEGSLDKQAGQQAVYPATMAIEGLASDGSVFALTGPLPEASALPLPVYLCQQDSIRLEGWISRLENGVAIGHVERWRVPASSLVKGEKVFILPKYRYEADN